MGQMQRVPSNNSSIIQRDGKTLVTLHKTVVVEFDGGSVTLRTGGWDTATTRARMNQASNRFCLGYSVYRDKGPTYVRNARGGVVELGNGVTFLR